MIPKFKPFPFVLLRTPKLPINSALELNKLDSETALRKSLLKWMGNTAFLEAIFFASPSLFSHIQAITANPLNPVDEKLLITVFKYVLRMSARCTPFGLFSGISLTDTATNASEITLSKKDLKAVSPSMEYIGHLTNRIVARSTSRKKLTFYLNTTLYELCDHYRYYKCEQIDGKCHYFLSKLKKNVYIQSVLEYTRKGIRYEGLIQFLQEMGVNECWCVKLIDNLIDSQLLVSEIEPSVAGVPTHNYLIKKLKRCGIVDDQADRYLRGIRKLSKSDMPMIARAEQIINLLPWGKQAQQSAPVLKADLRVGTHASNIHTDVLDIITQEVSEVLGLSNKETSVDLATFSKEFIARYGDREIPLMIALDPDVGIGYGNRTHKFIEADPLLSGLHLENGETHGLKEQMYGLLSKISANMQSFEQPADTVNLEEIIASTDGTKQHVLPPTAAIMGNLLAKSGDDLDRGNFAFHLHMCAGPSAVPLMARFAMLDERLKNGLKTCAQYVRSHIKNAVIAEVVHVPDLHVGNIMQRPSLYEYEIPFLCHSQLANDKQILLTDLMVSVRKGKVVLRSKRLNKAIVVRLSNAYNYLHGISSYKFLADMQHQDANLGLKWAWGDLDNHCYLPRVKYKHLILSRARWKIAPENVASMDDAIEYVGFIRRKYNLPQQVFLAEGDNELFLDLNNPLACDVLLAKLKKQQEVVLFETLDVHKPHFIKDKGNNNYCNELIIPLMTDTELNYPNFETPAINGQQIFAPGDGWTYLKVYCAAKEANAILKNNLCSLVETLKTEQTIENWHFCRYFDPHFHLRIRFKHAGNTNGAIIFADITSKIQLELKELLKNGEIAKIQFESYEREIERYGEGLMPYCEELFCLDSELLLSAIGAKIDENADLPWMLAMLGVDQLLDCVDFNIEQKLNMISIWRNSFHAEFGGKKKLIHQLNDKYRLNRVKVDRCFDDRFKNHLSLGRALELRGQRYREIFGKASLELDEAKTAGHLFHSILPSISHMFINRLFSTSQRENELVVYHFLEKKYNSIVGRRNKHLEKAG